jgi:hypothetical protein
MSKNLTRKGLALVSGSALVVTSLVGVAAPATAAPGDVVLYPTTGTGTAVFTTDTMGLTSDIQTAAGLNTARLAYRIDNPDQHQIRVTFSGGISAGTVTGIVKGTGAEVALGTWGSSQSITIDALDSNVVAVVFHSLTGHAASTSINVSLSEVARSSVTDAQANVGADGLEFGDRATAADARISVQSWVEVETTPDYTSVDAAFASDKLNVTYVDPSNVSVISEVTRAASTTVSNLKDVKFIVTGDQAIGTDGNANTDLGAGDTFQGVVLAAGDRILLVGNTTTTQDGVYVVQADGAGPADVAPVKVTGEKINGALTAAMNARVLVTGGTNAGKYYSITKLTGNADITATDVTGKAWVNLNQVGDDQAITGTLKFSRSDLNLRQVDLTKWHYRVETSGTAGDVSLTAIDLRAATEDFGTDNNFQVLSRAGVHDSLLIRANVGAALESDKTYQLSFKHPATGGAAGVTASEFISSAFTTVASPQATAVDVISIVTSTTDAKLTSGTAQLRAGTKAFTYRAQARTSGPAADAKFANIPMVAVVQARAFVPAGESITVTGSTKAITRANEAVVVSGLTNSDGQFSVTVTSTTAAAAQSYDVTFYIANGGSAGAFKADAAPITATYETAAPTAVTATPSIVASSDASVVVSVTDQFGVAISTNGTGALNVELKAPIKTNLEQFAAVVNGSATFNFKNYLKTGESDILTARVYTGTSTSPTYLALNTNVNLFAPVAVSAINVPVEVTGVIVNYADFITGKTSTAKPGPTDATKTVYTGTVVNANGAGIAGASVRITGTGFQFKSGTDFSVDAITVTTNAAGTFSVDMWTKVASAAGNRITVTSGDKTASTLVKSAVPSSNSPANVSTRNLSFSWNLPTTLVMNTTYSVTAKVTDKWGNGVPNAHVKFSGFGAAQFNGTDTVTRATNRNGEVTVFLRSLKDVDGPSAIGAELTGIGASATTVDQFITGEGLAAVYTDAATTAWDESKWSSSIEARVNFLKSGSGAATGAGTVNVGSFNGKLVVYAQNLDGKRISWKVGGNWGKATAVGNTLNRFDRPTPRRGVTVSVQIYVDGVLTLTKSVLTR